MQNARSSIVPAGLLFAVLTGAAVVPPRATTEDVKWEYLVASPGKLIFASPLDGTGATKLGGASAATLPILMESAWGQLALDSLGAAGWELVSVSGSIGGDQQFVLKRRFDEARSAAEAASAAKALAGAMSARDQAATDSGPVDLDAAEMEAETAKQQNRLRAAIEACGIKATEVRFRSARRVAADVYIDATQALVKAGSYRQSEAEAFLKKSIDLISNAAGLHINYSDGKVDLRLEVQISTPSGPRSLVSKEYRLAWNN